MQQQIPSPDSRLVTIVTDHWNASGIAQFTRENYASKSVDEWKQLHARVLYEGFSLAYYDRGITSFGVYPKSSGTRFVPDPAKPDEGYAEDICQILDAQGVMFYKDIGIAFGGENPSLSWGEFTRSSDDDQNPRAYLPPPRLRVAGTPEVPPQVPPQVPPSEVPALRARIAQLEGDVARLTRERDEARQTSTRTDWTDADYRPLLDTIAQANAAYFQGSRVSLTAEGYAHLCWRYLTRHSTPERVIEEARLRGAGLWTEQW